MKKCSKCKIEKDLSEFGNYKYNKSVDGLDSLICKTCRRKETNKRYNEKNKEKIKLIQKKYYQDNKEKIDDRISKYRKENIDKLKEYTKKYREENREEINNKICNSIKKRMKCDFLYRLRVNLRNSIYKSITRNGYTKKSRTHEILGCSYEEFKNHLESKFESWMSWDNYGRYNGQLNYGWDIDHIIPSSSAKSEEELIKLNHYTNLQPLCSKVNRDIKKDIIEYGTTD